MDVRTRVRTDKIDPPLTIQMLRRLRKGEEITYYRGDFDRDISACKKQGGNDKGAPTYAALLESVRDEARRLAKLGKIEKRAVPRKAKGQAPTYEYFAIGL